MTTETKHNDFNTANNIIFIMEIIVHIASGGCEERNLNADGTNLPAKLQRMVLCVARICVGDPPEQETQILCT